MIEVEGVSSLALGGDREAWTFDLPQAGGNAWLAAILLVSDEGLTFARFSSRGGMRKVRAAFIDAGGDVGKLGRRAIRVPRESLVRIGRTPAYSTIEVTYRGRFGRRILALQTPGLDAYEVIFGRLYRRFGAGRAVETERVRIDKIPIQPSHGSLLVAGIALLLGLVCGITEREPPHGMVPVVALVAFQVGQAIGPVGTWSLVALSGAVGAYSLYSLIAHRPSSFVVRFAGPRQGPGDAPR